MGSRGPAPKPGSSESKRGRNTMFRKSPVPPPPPGGVQMPESVQFVPAAKAFWQRVSPALIADGRLVAEQVDAFAILCRLHAEIRQLEDQVLAEGWITATDKGGQAASPVAKLLRDSRRDFVTLARDFGLTAAAAARIPQEPKDGEEDDDAEASLLKRLSVRG